MDMGDFKMIGTSITEPPAVGVDAKNYRMTPIPTGSVNALAGAWVSVLGFMGIALRPATLGSSDMGRFPWDVIAWSSIASIAAGVATQIDLRLIVSSREDPRTLQHSMLEILLAWFAGFVSTMFYMANVGTEKKGLISALLDFANLSGPPSWFSVGLVAAVGGLLGAAGIRIIRKKSLGKLEGKA